MLPCRLLPEFTPGRAMMWGTILALWGTAAIVATSSRGLGIKRVSPLRVLSKLVWRLLIAIPQLSAC